MIKKKIANIDKKSFYNSLLASLESDSLVGKIICRYTSSW